MLQVREIYVFCHGTLTGTELRTKAQNNRPTDTNFLPAPALCETSLTGDSSGLFNFRKKTCNMHGFPYINYIKYIYIYIK